MWKRILKVVSLGRLEPGNKIPVHIVGDDHIATSDLCDYCHVAVAKFRAVHWGKLRSLLFCAAHMRQHKAALEKQGWEIGAMQ